MNWVVGNLQYSLEVWNSRINEIYSLITQSPSEFKDGTIWNIVLNINGAMKAIGLALLVLFFVVGVIKTCGNFAEIKRPEQALRLFIRFVIAKGIVTYGLDLMLSLFKIVQGIIVAIMDRAGAFTATATLPQEIIEAVDKCSFFESIPLWAITLIGCLVVIILSFILILTVYGRFFKLYMYTAISPIMLSSFAGRPTETIGRSFLKSYVGVCLEGAIIAISCIIFSAFASSPPVVDINVDAVTMVWKYIIQLTFNMLVMVGTIKMSDRIVKEIM